MTNVILLIISITAIVIAVVCVRLILRLRSDIESFFSANSKFDLRSELRQHQARQHELKSLGDGIRASQDQIERLQQSSLQKYSLVRFNPFRNTGGDQSFCLCLLDLNDSGLLITAIHGRDGTRIYAKTINNGLSKQELSVEEKTAVKEAIKGRPSQPRS